MKRNGDSLAISPEGTRSLHGRLSSFKKGPFYTSIDLCIPITPILLFGAFSLWPPKQKIPHAGKVVVKFMKPIRIRHDETPRELRLRVHRLMLKVYIICITHIEGFDT